MSGYALENRRTIRSPKNPLDKCTIVSIYPKKIVERKVTIEPGVFTIEAGSFNSPAILVIGSSSWWRDIDAEQPMLEIPNSSIQVAEDVCTGYCNTLPDAIPGSAIPGLFFIMGEKSVIDVKMIHSAELALARSKQNAYWENCIRAADGLWARTNGNPMAISDEARLAAKEMNIDPKTKPWIGDFSGLPSLINCKACGSLVNLNYPICGNCKAIIDPEKAKELGLKFAV